MVCIRCQKRPAIIFIQRMENGQMKQEGYCLHCARELHIKPVDDLMKQFGMSEQDLDNMENRMESMMEELGDSNPLSMLMNMSGNGEDADAENISTGAERQRHYRAVTALKKNPCEENLWKCVVAFRGYKFKTLSGLPFTYKLKKGRGDEFTKELWIDRREDSKSLAWSSVMLAYHNIGKIGEVVDKPKALGDIRGVSYIYGVFYRFGLIDVPEKVKKKMTK